MKKASPKKSRVAMKPEYDFAAMKGGVRGKYADQYRQGTNLVLLDPDLATLFPTDAAVNKTLRSAVKLSQSISAASSKRSR